jgi:hypothetical protein
MLLLVSVIIAVGAAIAWGTEEKIALDKIPPKVHAAAKAKYPAAKLVSAEKEDEDGKTVYELAFDDKGHKIEVTFDNDGQIVEIEKQVTEQELPGAVRSALTKKYPGCQLKSIEEVTEGNSTSFEFLVVQTTEVKFGADGTVINEERKTPGEKD